MLKSRPSIFLVLLSFLFFFLVIFSYVPQKADASSGFVEKIYGGSEDDRLCSIIQTNDKNFIAVGWSYSHDITECKNHGFNDGYIAKLDPSGNIIWQQMVGGSKQDGLNSIIQISDNEYIAVGYSASPNIKSCKNKGKYDGYIIKFNSKGKILWEQTVGGDSDESFSSVIQTSSNNFIAVGYTKSDMISGIQNHGNYDGYMVQFDSKGKIITQKLIGGIADESLYSIKEIKEEKGSYMAVGYSNTKSMEGINNHGQTDGLIIKFDSALDIIWQRMVGGSENDGLSSIGQSGENEFIIGGYSLSNNISGCSNRGNMDIYLLKINGTGNILWEKMYGGSENDTLISVTDSDNGLITCAGWSDSPDFDGMSTNGYEDGLLLLINETGNILLKKNYGGKGSDLFLSACTVSNKGILAVGEYFKKSAQYSDFYLVIIDKLTK